MKIICIDNCYYSYHLTIGKVYNTIEFPDSHPQYYTVIDNRKMKNSYRKEFFITIKDQRKEKLQKIYEKI